MPPTHASGLLKGLFMKSLSGLLLVILASASPVPEPVHALAVRHLPDGCMSYGYGPDQFESVFLTPNVPDNFLFVPSKAPDVREMSLTFSNFYVANQTNFTTLPAKPNDNFPSTFEDKALVSAIGVLPILGLNRTAKISIDLTKDSSVRAFTLTSLKFACRNQLLAGDFMKYAKPISCVLTISCKSAHPQCNPLPAPAIYIANGGNDGPNNFAVSKTMQFDLPAAFQEVTECTFQTNLGIGALLIDNVDLSIAACETSAGDFSAGCPAK